MVKWLLVSLSVMPLVLFMLAQSTDRRDQFLPGRTSDGHHQIERKCQACHTPFSGVKQEDCLRCHAAALEAQRDSHAPSKFDDPGRAAQLARIDARTCVTCHREHRPEARLRGSVSVPPEFCVSCHADIGAERESHRGLAAASCAATACHNYHDNRSLHADVLRRHRAEQALKVAPRLPLRAAGTRAARASQTLSGPVPDAPGDLQSAPAVARATVVWAASSHARAGVNCSGCHERMPPGSGAHATHDQPPWPVEHGTCGRCHQDQHAGFLAGKHGMRLAVSLSAMAPRLARLAMKPRAADRSVGCTSCHDAHAFDLVRAAAAACEGCHDDTHTRAYRQSRHFELWTAEVSGRAPSGSGVSCATCHLPRRETRTTEGLRIQVQHNQNANLRPPDRMGREVCMHCHGQAFSLAALANPALVGGNFQGPPPAIRTAIDLLE